MKNMWYENWVVWWWIGSKGETSSWLEGAGRAISPHSHGAKSRAHPNLGPCHATAPENRVSNELFRSSNKLLLTSTSPSFTPRRSPSRWLFGFRIVSSHCYYYCIYLAVILTGASLVAQPVKNLPAMQETWVQSLHQEDPLEKRMATHSSILAWKIPWREKPGWLEPIKSQRLSIHAHTCFFSVEIEGWSNMHSQHGNIIAG